MSDQESGRRCPGCGKIADENFAQCDCGFQQQHDEDSDPKGHIDAVEEMFQAHVDEGESHWENLGEHAEEQPVGENQGILGDDFDAEEESDEAPPPPRKKHHHVLALVIIGHIAVLVGIWYVASDRLAQRNNSGTVVVRRTYTEGRRDESAPPRRTEFLTRAGTTARAIEERMNNEGVYCDVTSFSVSGGRADITLSKTFAWDLSELRKQIASDAFTVTRAVFDESSDVNRLNLEVGYPINEEARPPWPVVFSLDVSRDQARRALRQGGGAEQVIRALGGTLHQKLTSE